MGHIVNMPINKRIETLKQRLAKSRKFADSIDEISSRLSGDDCVRAGVSIEVVRATSKQRLAPNGEEFHTHIKASTDGIARDAGIIPMSAWSRGGLTNFNNNPVILAYHDHKLPIGISVHTALTDQYMDQYWRFHEHTETSKVMRKLYDEGYLRAASVGFLVHEWQFIDELEDEELETLVEKYGAAAVRDTYWIATEAELLETSAVPVPSDPNALQFSHAMRSAEAVGIVDISAFNSDLKRELDMNKDKKETKPEVKPETTEERTDKPNADSKPDAKPDAKPDERTDSSENPIEDNKEVTELRAEVAALRKEVDDLVKAVKESRTALAEKDSADDSDDDEDDDEMEIELEVRDGETSEQALDRIIEEKAKAQMGAPIASK